MPLCNINRQNPENDPIRDTHLLVSICRTILDSFCSTVKSNTRGLKRLCAILNNELGICKLLPEMGLFPLRDKWRMMIEVSILVRSLDQEIYHRNIEYETARKLYSVHSNCWVSSTHTITQGAMAKDIIKDVCVCLPNV